MKPLHHYDLRRLAPPPYPLRREHPKPGVRPPKLPRRSLIHDKTDPVMPDRVRAQDAGLDVGIERRAAKVRAARNRVEDRQHFRVPADVL